MQRIEEFGRWYQFADAYAVFQILSTECAAVSESSDQTDSRTRPALKYSIHMEIIN